jgi:hypothetical protein
MGAVVQWGKLKPASRVDAPATSSWIAPWLNGLKFQIAQIAFAKSLQQFGREEEKP